MIINIYQKYEITNFTFFVNAIKFIEVINVMILSKEYAQLTKIITFITITMIKIN